MFQVLSTSICPKGTAVQGKAAGHLIGWQREEGVVLTGRLRPGGGKALGGHRGKQKSDTYLGYLLSGFSSLLSPFCAFTAGAAALKLRLRFCTFCSGWKMIT